jgi:hypothetical protein
VPVPIPVSIGTVPIIQSERQTVVEYCNYCGYPVASSSMHLTCIENNASNVNHADYLLKMYKRLKENPPSKGEKLDKSI